MHLSFYSSDPIRIDCGYKNAIRTGEWEGDIYFEGGETHVVTGTQPAAIANTELKTLRTFPVNGTGSPCYSVPVNASRYLIRMGFLYGNYDRIGKPPSFLILLNQVTVHTINFLDDSEDNAVPYYTEYILYAKKAITICLKSLTGAPLVNSIEIFPQDIRSYNAIQLGTNVTLRTVFRLNAGGPSINGSADVFHRIWTGDLNVDSNRSVQVTPLLTVTPTKSLGASISGTIVGTGESSPPDYLPTKVFHSARVGLASSPVIQFKFSVSQVNPLHSWFLRLLFTEIDYTTKVGERVFDVFLSAGNESQIIKNYDVLADSGVTAASNKTFQFGLQNAGSNVEFSFGCRMANSSRKPPLLSGFELLSVIPSYLDPDFFTFPPPPPLPPPIDDSASLPPPPPVSTQGTHNSSEKYSSVPNFKGSNFVYSLISNWLI